MITMPGNMCICSDCMQKAFDSLQNNGIDFSKIQNMPYMNLNFNDFMPGSSGKYGNSSKTKDKEKNREDADSDDEGHSCAPPD